MPYPLRFLFAGDPAAMGAALGIAYRTIASFQLYKAGLTRCQGECGAVTVIQRFGSALNLNVHFHMLFPDGVYGTSGETVYLRSVAPPTPEELQALVQQISERIGRHLERQGILSRDAESSQLQLGDEDARGLQPHSLQTRIARECRGGSG